MKRATHPTYDAAIENEILTHLDATPGLYDIEAIAAAALEYDEALDEHGFQHVSKAGYRLTETYTGADGERRLIELCKTHRSTP